MKKPHLLSLVLLSIIWNSNAQVATLKPDKLIEWNEFYNLIWSDFQGRPTSESVGDAGTAVKISAKPYYIKKRVKFEVYAFFDRNISWKRDTSTALLKHERLHFDIAELYARKIRKQISKMNDQGVTDIKIYNAAIRELLEQSNEADIRYDYETLHGALLKKQEAWQKKIKEELLGLKDYKKRRNVISAAEALKNRPVIYSEPSAIADQGE